MTAILILGLFFGLLAAIVWCASRGWIAVGATLAVLMLTPLAASAGALSDFATAAAPGVVELIGLALTGIIGWAATRARAKWGIEIEATHRAALHSALMSGIRAALLRGLQGSEAVEAAIIHASGSVPDAIKALQPDGSVLTRIAEAKLRDALNELPLVTVGEEGLAG